MVFYVGTTPTDADASVTVDIFRGDGSIFATDAATTHGTTGHYSYTLAPQSVLERFQLVWEGTFGGVVQRQSPTSRSSAGTSSRWPTCRPNPV